MKKDYIKNINSILKNKSVENQKLENISLLKDILLDSKISNNIYKQFVSNFELINDYDLLYTKTQDLVYRLNYAIHWLIEEHNIKNSNELKNIIEDLVYKNIDLYSSVSYDESDEEMIEEFNYLYEKRINL